MLNGGQPRFFRAPQPVTDWISQKNPKGPPKDGRNEVHKNTQTPKCSFLTEWKIYGTFFGKHK